MNEAKTIDEVLVRLDQIIEETLTDNSYAGVFAYVYRRTTAEIKKAIEQNRFEDCARMEKMDVIFANLYINAFEQYKAGGPVSKSWKISFDVQKNPLTIVQHLMLGMNAHINLDLGQAASIIAPGNKIKDIEHDFMEVNKVLAELTDVMQKKLGKVSRLMMILDWIGQRSDEKLVNFSMIKARRQAWTLAEDLAAIENEADRKNRIDRADLNISKLGNILIYPPGVLLKTALMLVGLLEDKNVRKIIVKLNAD